MPFVKRDKSKEIIAISRDKTDECAEFVEPNDAELEVFFKQNSSSNVHSALRESDTELARIAEDLIQLLIQKNMIIFTELPEPVQKKILLREKLRSEISQPGTFMDEEGSI